MSKNVKKAIASATKNSRSRPAAKPTRTIGNIENAFTKSQALTVLAQKTDISKQQITSLFISLQDIIAAHFKKTPPKQFILPGLIKITVNINQQLKPIKALIRLPRRKCYLKLNCIECG